MCVRKGNTGQAVCPVCMQESANTDATATYDVTSRNKLLNLLITFDPDWPYERSQQSVVELNSSKLEKVFQKCFEILLACLQAYTSTCILTMHADHI